MEEGREEGEGYMGLGEWKWGRWNRGGVGGRGEGGGVKKELEKNGRGKKWKWGID